MTGKMVFVDGVTRQFNLNGSRPKMICDAGC